MSKLKCRTLKVYKSAPTKWKFVTIFMRNFNINLPKRRLKEETQTNGRVDTTDSEEPTTTKVCSGTDKVV